MEWDLSPLYEGFESKLYQEDFKSVQADIKELTDFSEKAMRDTHDTIFVIEKYLLTLSGLTNKLMRLFHFCELSLSTNARNEVALKGVEQLEDIMTALTKPQVRFQYYLASLDDLSSLCEKSKILKDHRFYLEENLRESKHLLSEEEEVMLSKLQNTGSRAWQRLQELLTSTLMVEMDGKILPLPEVRNMAHSADPQVRQKAYEAELTAYPSIADSVAACLSGIKGEVNTVCEMRRLSSPLTMTVEHSRMDEQTLSVMWQAVEESLPSFHAYLKKKAQVLGRGNCLPFYDLFAPIGKSESDITYEKAQEMIITQFSTFSDALGQFAKKAFDQRWIDVFPRQGKRGGAFCSNLHEIGESRILTNFTGTLSDVLTLAHELGHAYHGDCLKEELPLNSDYPMPIAETASIFCETLVKEALMKDASQEQRIYLLETDLQDSTQVIVDIYSRFIFEKSVFDERKDGSLSAERLNQLMIEAQRKAYGHGLDENILHSMMWVPKPHYYEASMNYYNFPYAYGLLFAKGLFAKYEAEGKSFVTQYVNLLKNSGKHNLADVAKMAGIDIHSIEFWRTSLEGIKDQMNQWITQVK